MPALIQGDLLHLQLVLEPCDHITPHNLLYLALGVLVYEFIDAHKATADPYLDMVTFLNLDEDASLPELIDTF